MKNKWYFAPVIDGNCVEVFRSETIPTQESYGKKYKLAFGPYNTRKEAVIKANYQYTMKVVIVKNGSK